MEIHFKLVSMDGCLHDKDRIYTNSPLFHYHIWGINLSLHFPENQPKEGRN